MSWKNSEFLERDETEIRMGLHRLSSPL